MIIAILTKDLVRCYPAVERAIAAARTAYFAADHSKDGAEAPTLAAAEAEAAEAAMENPGICYLLKVPTLADVARLETRIDAAPGRAVSPIEFRRVLAEGVRAVVLPEQIDRCIELLDQFDAAIDGLARGELLPDDFAKLATEKQEIEETVREHHPPYARLVELDGLKSRHARIERLRLFVVEAEGKDAAGRPAPVLVRSGAGGLSDATLKEIVDRGDFEPLDARIRALLRPDPDAVGNSGSPALSTPRAQAISTAAKKRPMGRHGKSSGDNTSATQS